MNSKIVLVYKQVNYKTCYSVSKCKSGILVKRLTNRRRGLEHSIFAIFLRFSVSNLSFSKNLWFRKLFNHTRFLAPRLKNKKKMFSPKRLLVQKSGRPQNCNSKTLSLDGTVNIKKLWSHNRFNTPIEYPKMFDSHQILSMMTKKKFKIISTNVCLMFCIMDICSLLSHIEKIWSNKTKIEMRQKREQ